MLTAVQRDQREALNEALVNDALNCFLARLAGRQRTSANGRISLEAVLHDGFLVRAEVIDQSKEVYKPRSSVTS